MGSPMNTVLDTQINNPKDVSSHNVLCTNPQYRGQRYTRLRSRHLRTLGADPQASNVQKVLAQTELERRSHIDSKVLGKKYEITLHSLDRLSTLYLHKFMAEFDGVEGISSWCNRLVKEALTQHPKCLGLAEFSLRYEGIQFSFRQSDYQADTLVLTTIC